MLHTGKVEAALRHLSQASFKTKWYMNKTWEHLGLCQAKKLDPHLYKHTQDKPLTPACIWERACFYKCAVSVCTFQWWNVWTFCLITCINLRFTNLMSHENKNKFWSTSDRHFTIPWGTHCTARSHDMTVTRDQRMSELYLYLHSFTLAFSRRFYPKRLTVHPSTVSTFYQLLLSLGIEPMILALLVPCSTSWATCKPLMTC